MGWIQAAYQIGNAVYQDSKVTGANAKAAVNSRYTGSDADDARKSAMKSEAYDTRQSDDYQGTLMDWANQANGRKAPQAGPAHTTGAAYANAAHIDTTQSDASRAQMQAAYNQFAQQAAGKGPSVATQQMGANVDAANAANMAFAASARGHVNPMLAARQAMMGNAANLQAGARDSAMLRVQEQLNGQNAMWQAAYGMHGQDMQGAQAQAALSQQANLANAGFQQQSGMFNADSQNKVALANLEASLRQRGYNDAQIANALAMKQSQMQSDKANKMHYWDVKANQDTNQAQLGQQKAMYDQDRQDKIYAGIAQGAAAGAQYGADAYGNSGGSGTPSGSESLSSYYNSTES